MALTQITSGGVDENINIDSGTLKVDGHLNRVGIGTTAPSRSLDVSGNGVHVSNTGTTGAAFNIIPAANGQDGAELTLSYHSGTGYGPLKFNVGNGERLRIDSSGNVGIGTTSPGTLLEIKSDGTAANEARVSVNEAYNSGSSGFGIDFKRTYNTGGANQDAGYIRMLRDGGDSNAGLTFATGNRGSVSERLRIDSSGNVGIGTTSPTTPLTVQGDTNANSVRLLGRSSDDRADLHFYENDGSTFIASLSAQSNSLNLFLGSSSGELKITGNQTIFRSEIGTERMRIDSSGRLLVGASSTSLTSKLLVRARTDDSNGNGSITLQRGSMPSAVNQSIGAVLFTDSGDNYGAWLLASSEGAWSSGSSHPTRLVFSTTASGGSSPAERMRIDSEGQLSLIGNGGSANNSLDLIYSGISGQAQINADSNGGSTYLTFGTSSSGTLNERMRITHGGNILMGKTAATATGAGVEVRPVTSGQLIIGKTYSGTVNGIYFNHGSSYVGGLNYSNTGTSLQTSSDYRLKENIVAVPNAIERAKQLNPVRFNFIIEPNETVEGFIAHELGQVIPEACYGEKDAVNEDGSVKPQTIAQEKIIPLLTAALQEAIAKIETLETKVAALEAAE